MSIINKISSKKEKNVLLNLFGGRNLSDEEESSVEDEEEQEIEENKGIEKAQDKQVFMSEERSDDRIYFHTEFAEDIQIELIQRRQLGIAFQLWPAATLLAEYLISNPDTLLNGVLVKTTENTTIEKKVNVIELGAGLGLTGMYISKYFNIHTEWNIQIQKTVLTDLPDVMTILQENIALNKLSHNVYSHPLDWMNPAIITEIFARYFNTPLPESSPPVVIAADVVYWESLFVPLVDTLVELCKLGCKVIMSHIRRWKKDQKFFQLCKKHGLQVTTLLEKIEMIPHEHTKELQKQISRIYLICK